MTVNIGNQQLVVPVEDPLDAAIWILDRAADAVWETVEYADTASACAKVSRATQYLSGQRLASETAEPCSKGDSK